MGTGRGAAALPLSLPGQAAFVPGGGRGQTPARPASVGGGGEPPRPHSSPPRQGPRGPTETTQPCALLRGRLRRAVRWPQSAFQLQTLSPPPAQGRVSKPAALHTPRRAPAPRAAGRRDAPQPAAPEPEGRRQGYRAPGRRQEPWGLDGAGEGQQAGLRCLRSPRRACPAPRTNRSHIQGESCRARPLPRPCLSAPEPMARRGGRAGLGAVRPPRVIIRALGRASAPPRWDP